MAKKARANTKPSRAKTTSRPDHYLRSSYREMLLNHLFVGEILRHLWGLGHYAEVLWPEVDDGGYDVVLDCGGIIRHIQVKASHVKSKTARINVNMRLATKPSGCVVWLVFDEETLEFDRFLWFGGSPDKKLPSIRKLTIAKHTKANAQGVKTERPGIRVLPKAKFDRLETISELAGRLFGSKYRRKHHAQTK